MTCNWLLSRLCSYAAYFKRPMQYEEREDNHQSLALILQESHGQATMALGESGSGKRSECDPVSNWGYVFHRSLDRLHGASELPRYRKLQLKMRNTKNRNRQSARAKALRNMKTGCW